MDKTEISVAKDGEITTTSFPEAPEPVVEKMYRVDLEARLQSAVEQLAKDNEGLENLRLENERGLANSGFALDIPIQQAIINKTRFSLDKATEIAPDAPTSPPVPLEEALPPDDVNIPKE